jgi:hypothetical protein
MAITYFQLSTTSDLTGPGGTGGTTRHLVASGTAGGGDTALISGNMNSGLFCNQNFFTPSGAPGVDGATGNYSVAVRCTAASVGETVNFRVFLARYNAAGVLQGSEVEAPGGSQTAIASTTRTFTWTAQSLGTWAAGDRLLTRVQITNSSGSMNQTATINVDSSADTIVTPFVVGAVNGSATGVFGFTGAVHGINRFGTATGTFGFTGAGIGMVPGVWMVNRAVVASSDDGVEVVATVPTTVGSALLMSAVGEHMAVRITDLPYQNGATVSDARLILTIADSAKNDAEGTWYAHDIDDSPTLQHEVDGDIDGRTKTTASVAWTTNDLGTAGNQATTPSLAAVVQEVVDRPGWQPGNNITFLYVHNSATDLISVAAYDAASFEEPAYYSEYRLVPQVVGIASGLFGFTGAVAGEITGGGQVTGTATGVFGFTGAAAGVPNVQGAATGTFTFTDAVAGTVVPLVLPKTSGMDPVDKSSYATASVTIGGADKVALVAVLTINASSPNTPTLSGPTGTDWAVARDFFFDQVSTFRRLTVFAGTAASETTGTITIDYASQNQATVLWSVVEAREVDTATSKGVVQSAQNQVSGTVLTVTLPGAIGDPVNLAVGVFVNGSNTTFTPGDGFLELHDLNASPEAADGTLLTEWKFAGADTTVDATAAVTDPDLAGIALELLSTLAAGGPVTGTATGIFGYSGAVAGVPRVQGAVTGPYVFTGAAAGVGRTPGTATGDFGFTGATAGVTRAFGTATGIFTFTGSAAGGVTGGAGFTFTPSDSQSAAGTNHTVTVPDGSDVVGKTVVIAVVFDLPTTPGWPSGWTASNQGATGVQLSVGRKIIDGTEGFTGTGDTITVTSSASMTAVHLGLGIGGAHASTVPEVAVVAGGPDNSVNPPTLNPAGWDIENALWLAVGGTRFNNTVSSAPANYTDLQTRSHTTNSDNGTAMMARRELSAASEDPGTFAIVNSEIWVAATVAVRPGVAGGEVNGTATGVFGFTGTTTGVARAVGTATGTFGFTGATAGVARSVGTATGSFGFTGDVAGEIPTGAVNGSATGTFTFTGATIGQRRATGTATGTFTYVGTTAGMRRLIGAPTTGDYVFAGVVSGGVPPTVPDAGWPITVTDADQMVLISDINQAVFIVDSNQSVLISDSDQLLTISDADQTVAIDDPTQSVVTSTSE